MQIIDFTEQNQKFSSLSPSEQCVAICEDALVQIDLRHLLPKKMRYFDLDSEERLVGTDDLQQILHQESVQCEVCAMGAIFASAVRLGDDVQIQPQDRFDLLPGVNPGDS